MATKNLWSFSQIKASTTSARADDSSNVNLDKSRNVRGKQGVKVGSKQLHLTGFLGDSKVPQGSLSRSSSFPELQRPMPTGGTKQVPSDSETEPDLEQPVLLPNSTWSDAVVEQEMAENPRTGDSAVQLLVGSWADRVAMCMVTKDVNLDKSAEGCLKESDHLGGQEVVIVLVPVPPDESLMPSIKGQAVQHKAEVPPIFLAYKCVSSEGERILLVQIAMAIIQAMHSDSTLDAVQPMKMGWHIYMRTLANRAKLVERGLHIAGCYMLLWSEVHLGALQLMKVTLKDLPLHCVDNEDVLDSLCKVCKVNSTVKYSNLWYNGKAINIRNGDRYVCVYSLQISKLLEVIHVGDYPAQVFKPVAMS